MFCMCSIFICFYYIFFFYSFCFFFFFFFFQAEDGIRDVAVTGVQTCALPICGALFETIDFQNGQILTAKFSRYRVPRFSDMAPIEIVLLDRKDLPSAGAGETPIVGLAPAVSSAIFEATGQRLRALPLVPTLS